MGNESNFFYTKEAIKENLRKGGYVIAQRRSGKTTAILEYARELSCQGKVVIVAAHDENVRQVMRNVYHSTYGQDSRVDFVSSRKPFILYSYTWQLDCPQEKDLFILVDEAELASEEFLKSIDSYTGLLTYAATLSCESILRVKNIQW